MNDAETEAVGALMALGDVLQWRDDKLPEGDLTYGSYSSSSVGEDKPGRSSQRYEIRACLNGHFGWRVVLEHLCTPYHTDVGPILPSVDAAKNACAYHHATGNWDWGSMTALTLSDRQLSLLVKALSDHVEHEIGELDTIYYILAGHSDQTGKDLVALEQNFKEMDHYTDTLEALLKVLQPEVKRREFAARATTEE